MTFLKKGLDMKTQLVSFFVPTKLKVLAASSLLAFLSMPVQAANEEDEQLKAMEAAAERVKQGAKDFEENLKRVRAERQRAQEERERLQTKQAAERKLEEERARDQAAKDASALAAAKDKERKALQAAQEQARREAAARVEQAERERKAELAEKVAREEKLARAKAALEKMNAQRGMSWDSGGAPQQAQQPQQQAVRVVLDPACIDNPDPKCGSGANARPQAQQQAAKSILDQSCIDNPDPKCAAGVAKAGASAKR
jgi:membrane protein involved in colicin uptake